MTSTKTTTNASSQRTVAPLGRRRSAASAARSSRPIVAMGPSPERHRDRVEEEAGVAGRRLPEVGRPEVGRAAERDGEPRDVRERLDPAAPRATARGRRRRRRPAASMRAARARPARTAGLPRHGRATTSQTIPKNGSRDGRRLRQQRGPPRPRSAGRATAAAEPIDERPAPRPARAASAGRRRAGGAPSPPCTGRRQAGPRRRCRPPGAVARPATARPNRPGRQHETAVRARVIRRRAPGAASRAGALCEYSPAKRRGVRPMPSRPVT